MDIGEIKQVWQVEPLAVPLVPEPVEAPAEELYGAAEAHREDVERVAAGDRPPPAGTPPG